MMSCYRKTDHSCPGPRRATAIAALVLGLMAGAAGTVPSPGAEGKSPAGKGEKPTTSHWSYLPVRRPEAPHTGDAWAQGEIDEFLAAKLQEQHLEPSGPADRRTLIRRLYLVMHGLPPSPEQVEAFAADTRPDAWERLVEEVLASPHYGERWARHWLDVVRYADSNGFETNRERKTAWPYRDYVIDAYNSDKPWNQFVREQMAGDALGADAATGFLVAGPYDIVKSPDINLSLAQREDELADMVNTAGTAFLGLTMGCARCHNHKFDPILQKDYFAMQAVFAGVTHGERSWHPRPDPAKAPVLAELRKTLAATEGRLQELRIMASAPAPAGGEVSALRPPVNHRMNVEEFPPAAATAVRLTITASSGAEPCVDEVEIYDEAGHNVALASAGAVGEVSGTLSGYEAHKQEHINDGRTGNNRSWISNTSGSGWVKISFPSAVRIHRIVWSRDRTEQFPDRLPTAYRFEIMSPPAGGPVISSKEPVETSSPAAWTVVASSETRQPFAGGKTDPDAVLSRLTGPQAEEARRLKAEAAELRSRLDGLEGASTAWLGTFSQPGPTFRLHRGDPLQKKEAVAPGALTVLDGPEMEVDTPEQQRRLRLGDWMASADNPLTARVQVNRIWHYIFGCGIVDTPSDLGVNGSHPTHPELLDWMADEFMKSGWSVKHMQRLILRSAAFRQASTPRAEALKADADARLLWRFPPRRLEAEAIRDCMLSVAGTLNQETGGPGFYLVDVENENVMHYFPKEKFTPAEFRRMVYQTRIRQTNDGVFRSLDCPDGSLVMPRRSRSNTPLQALNLFNSRFVLQQADFFAGRLTAQAGTRPGDQVELAYRLLCGRAPDGFEKSASTAFIESEGLPAFCRALFNTSEFLFVF